MIQVQSTCKLKQSSSQHYQVIYQADKELETWHKALLTIGYVPDYISQLPKSGLSKKIKPGSFFLIRVPSCIPCTMFYRLNITFGLVHAMQSNGLHYKLPMAPFSLPENGIF